MPDERTLDPNELSDMVRKHLGLLKELRPKQIVGLIAFIGDVLDYESTEGNPWQDKYGNAAQKLVGVLEDFYGNRPDLRADVLALSIGHESVFVRLQVIHHLLALASDGRVGLAETYAKILLADTDEGVRIDARPVIIGGLEEFVDYGASEQFVEFVNELPHPQY